MSRTSLDFAEFLLKRAMLVGVALLVLTLASVAVIKRLSPSASTPSASNPASIAPAASATAASATAASATAGVELSIEFDRTFVKTFRDVPVSDAASVLSILQAAAKPGHRFGLDLDITGSGEMAFVLAIDGVANQGGGTAARNWQFWVNGSFAKVGAGATRISPGDKIIWTFGTWEAPPTSQAHSTPGTADNRPDSAPADQAPAK